MNNLADVLPDKAKELDDELRNIVDYEAVDKCAKDYDRDSFRVWRAEHRLFGTYKQDMAVIHSGYDDCGDFVTKEWTDEEEARLISWLEKERYTIMLKMAKYNYTA